MEPTIIEQIESANAQIQTLGADLTAANALLAEAQTKATADAETIRALRQSATANSPLANASGLRLAHCRAATATSASCSRVVPYSCICRAAASA